MVRLRIQSRFSRNHVAVALTIAMTALTIAAKPPPKPKPKDPVPAAPQAVTLPGDLNLASLRVHAVDAIYELDLSADQLAAIKTASTDAATDRKRTTPPANEKLTTAFIDVYKALLNHQDDEDIAKLRNHLMELASDDDAHLDDEVEPTETAKIHASAVCKRLGAGQIAAYLAAHADQISDPDEKMVSALSDLREATDTGEDTDTEMRQTADEIAMLIAGQDKKTAADVTDKVTTWLKSKKDLTDEQLITDHASLLASAKKVIGDVPPMDILSHWMDNEIAELLSNPQLPEAIEAVLTAQSNEQK